MNNKTPMYTTAIKNKPKREVHIPTDKIGRLFYQKFNLRWLIHLVIKYSPAVTRSQAQKRPSLSDKREHNSSWEKKTIFQELNYKRDISCVYK